MTAEALLDALPLRAKVGALRQPQTYPGYRGEVSAVETHMSWLFLTDAHAYKLKKPRRDRWVDLTTAEARRENCLEELRLNRRLAPHIYLDVVPLARDDHLSLRVGGAGRVEDWLVMMRRLPAGEMLDSLLRRSAATPGQMRRIAVLLCRFYTTLQPAALDATDYCARLEEHIADDERALCAPAYGMPLARVHALCGWQQEMLKARARELEARVAGGHVVEGHGDLRPEHVHVGTPPAVIDCLEFSAELRTLDTADEIGYLALECERACAARLAVALLQEYRKESGDTVGRGLVHFYQSCRARTRSLLAIAHVREDRYRDSPEWPRRAHDYLRLAERHLEAAMAIAAVR